MARFLKMAVLIALCLNAGAVFAAERTSEEASGQISNDENVDYKVVTKEGLNFRVPVDMPIEKRNGIVAPISTEEYIHGKFKKLDKRLDGIEEKLGETIKAIRDLQAEGAKVCKPSAESKSS